MGWIIWISPPFIPNRYQALLTISSFFAFYLGCFFFSLLSWVFFLCLLLWVFPFALYLGWVCLLASILGVISLPSNLGANSILAVFFFAFYHGCYFSLPFILAVFSLPSISAVFSLTSILVGCICIYGYIFHQYNDTYFWSKHILTLKADHFIALFALTYIVFYLRMF